MSSFFPCEIDDAIQYINLRHEAQAPKIVIVYCIFSYVDGNEFLGDLRHAEDEKNRNNVIREK